VLRRRNAFGPARFLNAESGSGKFQAEQARQLSRTLGQPELRELVPARHVLLYAHSGAEVVLLSLRHERQPGYGLPSRPPGEALQAPHCVALRCVGRRMTSRVQQFCEPALGHRCTIPKKSVLLPAPAAMKIRFARSPVGAGMRHTTVHHQGGAHHIVTRRGQERLRPRAPIGSSARRTLTNRRQVRFLAPHRDRLPAPRVPLLRQGMSARLAAKPARVRDHWASLLPGHEGNNPQSVAVSPSVISRATMYPNASSARRAAVKIAVRSARSTCSQASM